MNPRTTARCTEACNAAQPERHPLSFAQAAAHQARDWELENIERHKEGTMNAAELGMANLKNAMKDPSVMGEMAQMMKDPENMAALKKMMSDPSFQQQASAPERWMLLLPPSPLPPSPLPPSPPPPLPAAILVAASEC